MIQYKVFVGTIADIEAAFNGWAAALVNGVNVNAGPLTNITGPAGECWLKEVIYILPARSGIAVPKPVAANGGS